MQLKTLLTEFSLNHNQLLIIDGPSLTTAFLYHEKLFFTTSTMAQSVVCCRCSPTQKAKIAEGIK
jgi:phospholipid-translocating ATPase